MTRESFHIDFIIKIWPRLLQALPITVLMALGAIVFGCLLGFLVTLVKISRYKKTSAVLDVITVVIRAVPEVVLIYLVYFGLPVLFEDAFGLDIGGWAKPVFVVLALTIQLSASSSELFRSAYNSLDAGQLEAAHAIGMTGLQRFRRIIFPQGLYVILPNLSGLCLGIIQATSLAFTLGVMDVMGKAKVLDSNAFSMNTFEAYLLVAFIYWALSFIEGQIFRLLEMRMGRGLRTVAGSV